MYIPGFSEPGFYAGFSEKAHQTQIKQSCPCLPILPNKNDKSTEVSFLPILLHCTHSKAQPFVSGLTHTLIFFQNLTFHFGVKAQCD